MEKPASPDDQLEARIDMAALALATASTPARRKAAWQEMQALIRKRSYERVRQMESEKGLR